MGWVTGDDPGAWGPITLGPRGASSTLTLSAQCPVDRALRDRQSCLPLPWGQRKIKAVGALAPELCPDLGPGCWPQSCWSGPGGIGEVACQCPLSGLLCGRATPLI